MSLKSQYASNATGGRGKGEAGLTEGRFVGNDAIANVVKTRILFGLSAKTRPAACLQCCTRERFGVDVSTPYQPCALRHANPPYPGPTGSG